MLLFRVIDPATSYWQNVYVCVRRVVYICAGLICRHVCLSFCECVLDRWAGDSDRLVCSQRYLVFGSESSSSYSYGCRTHACTHTFTQTGVYTCMHTLSAVTHARSHSRTLWAYTLTHTVQACIQSGRDRGPIGTY